VLTRQHSAPILFACRAFSGLTTGRWHWLGQAQTVPTAAPRAVLVTGASAGVGRKITERLAADGFFVFAGARKDEDLKALGGRSRTFNLPALNATMPSDIDAAVGIRSADRGESVRTLYLKACESRWWECRIAKHSAAGIAAREIL